MQVAEKEVGSGEQATYPEDLHAAVDRYAGDLYRLAWSLTGNPADAEDLLQDTFLGALQGWKAFEGRSSIRTWLTRILVRQAARLYRRRRIRRALSLEELGDRLQELAAGRTEQKPEAEVDLRKMLDSLSPRHREVLVLRELQGLSYAEISEILGIPTGTVESRLHRARRDLLGRYGGAFA